MMVNIDDRGSYFHGVAYINDADSKLPSFMATVRTHDKAASLRFNAGLLPVNPRTGLADAWDNLKHLYPNIKLPTNAEVAAEWNDKALSLRWKTDIGTEGSAILPRGKRDHELSDYEAVSKNWVGYKEYVAPLLGKRFMFRGQNKPWRLRTKFHRTGRAELGRFVSEDIQTLHRQLVARTRHVFNLDIPNENGAFFSLVQHHGYPSPLLDWTYSPYVAAFFAYRGISNLDAGKAPPEAKTRIVMFDQQEWRNDFNQVVNLNVNTPHFSIMDFLAIDNERMIPQQATSTVTNIDDIEGYVRRREEERGKTYLRVIDLPVGERMSVMGELAYMGITAGSLFPGLDGACEELKERFFGL